MGELVEGGLDETDLPSPAYVKTIIDTFCKTRNQWPHPNEERGVRPPIPSTLVPIDPVVFVQLVDVEPLLFDEVVVCNHDAGERTHEAGVAG